MLPRAEIKTILVFRALQLGDLLCSVPAFRALRNFFPEAHIAIAGLPWQKVLPERFSHYFNEFISFPGYPGLPEQPVHAENTVKFLLEMNRRRFDLALQMQGNGSFVNPMVELFGARFTGGYHQQRDYKPASPFFMEYPDGIPEVHRHLSLMEHLGIPSCGDDLEYPLNENDHRELVEASLNVQTGKYICVHPGSRGSYRQWPPAQFAEAADLCAEKGYSVVLTGTPDELEIVQEVAAKMQNKPVIAAGKTTLGSIGALLESSGGLISNCTGVSHIASALKVKSVLISMDGEPRRWAPLNQEKHIMIDWTKTPDTSLVMQAIEEHFPPVYG